LSGLRFSASETQRSPSILLADVTNSNLCARRANAPKQTMFRCAVFFLASLAVVVAFMPSARWARQVG
jgi:hypothetical protein